MIYINKWDNKFYVITPMDKSENPMVIQSYSGFATITAAWLLLDKLNVGISDRSISSLFPSEDIQVFYKYFNKIQGRKQVEMFPDQQILF